MKQLVKIVVIMGIFGFCSCNVLHKELNEKKFTKKFYKELAAAHPERNFEITDNLVIFCRNEKYSLRLENAYCMYKSDPCAVKEIMTRYINVFSKVLSGEVAVRADGVVPLVKSADYIEFNAEVNNINVDDFTAVRQKYNDQLIILFAKDSEETFATFSLEDLETLKIERDSLLGLSLENLKRTIPKINLYGGEGIYMVTVGGNYEASLILWDEIWTKENFDVKGDFVIAIPNRDMLYVTGSEDRQGIEWVKKHMKKSYNEGSYPVSPYLFKRNGNKFEKFE